MSETIFEIGFLEPGNNRIASDSELFVNPFLAHLYSMLLSLLFTFEQLALDSLNLDDRSELALLVNNTN